MEKLTFIQKNVFIFLIGFLGWNSASFAQDYCIPTSGRDSGHFINKVLTKNALINLNYHLATDPEEGYLDETDKEVEVYAGQIFEMDVDYFMGSHSGDYTITAWIDWNEDFSFEKSEIIYSTISSFLHSFTVTIPQDINNGEYTLRVRGMYGSTIDTLSPCSHLGHGTTVDFKLNVVDIPSCPSPNSFHVATMDISENEAIVSWNASGTEAIWNLSIGKHGFQPGDANEIENLTLTSKSYTIQNLQVGDTIDVFVRADCGVEKSEWAETITLIFGYCIPEGTDADFYIHDFITTKGIHNINNTNTNFSPKGYGDFTATHKVTQVQGKTIDFKATMKGSDGGIRIWVDWNQNGIFDTKDEVAYVSEDWIFTHNGTITVPQDALPGLTRMRIVNHGYDEVANVSPCASFDEGEFEDYTFEVIQHVDCEEVVDAVEVEDKEVCPNVSFTLETKIDPVLTANLTIQWETSDDKINWQTIAGASQNSHIVEGGITQETYYRYTLTCDSDNEKTSEVITVNISPQRECYCQPIIDCEDDDVILRVVFQEIDNNTGCSPKGYGDYSNMTAKVMQGETYPIEVTVGDGFMEHVFVWIDFGKDGSFDAEDFRGEIGNGIEGGTLSGFLTIPFDVEPDNYRMRILSLAGDDIDTVGTCGNVNFFGEYEDYTLVVEEASSLIKESLTKITVYPNPAKTQINISGIEDADFTVEISDMKGRIVFEEFSKNNLDISSLEKGIYTLRIYNDKEQSITKIVKQ